MSASSPAAQRVTVTSTKHAVKIGCLEGLVATAERLKAQTNGDKLPGFALALSIVERDVADARSSLIYDNLRLAAKGGIDVTTMASLSMGYENGKWFLEAKPMDLADMGEVD